MNTHTIKTYGTVLLCGLAIHNLIHTNTFDALDSIEQRSQNYVPDIDTITFNYEKEDLINIINYIASRTEKNIILPQGAHKIKATVTYKDDKALSLHDAWNQVISFLDIAGYAVIEKDNHYEIIKTNKEIAREGLPVYINADAQSLPQSDELIVYVHYFSNIKVGQEGSSELQEIIKTIFPENTKFAVDAHKNALVIAAKARDILQLISIATQLDRSGFKEKIDIIQLRYSSASIVADLFNQNILQQDDGSFNRYRLDTRKKSDSTYFSQKMRIIANERTNSLITIGNEQAIDRLKAFIMRYIDIELEEGRSILHVYRLQYLDANEFAPILERIVQQSDIGASGQARDDRQKSVGPERYFDEVIIAVDRPQDAENIKYNGGNNLIIACDSDDWNHIKEIIEELDAPIPQVFLEIVVADLTLDDARLLGSLTRNPDKIPIINMTEFQSSHLTSGAENSAIIVDDPSNPMTIAGDLSRATNGETSEAIDNIRGGSTTVTLNDNDGQTWSIMQMLKLFSHSKIISHPHVVATNNTDAFLKIGQYRLVDGSFTGSGTTNPIRKQEPFTAALEITITPRISSDTTVNLNVVIDIEEFSSSAGEGSNDAKDTRTIKTNANVNSESILTLGGLMRSNNTQDLSATPGLSELPVIGWMFKRRASSIQKNNLTVFIAPTIVQPQLRKGIGTHTRDYIDLASKYADESVLFDSLRDPITRLFFRTDETFGQELDEFVDEDQFITEESIVAMPTPRKKQSSKKHNDTSNTHNIQLTELLQAQDNPFEQNKQMGSKQELSLATRDYDIQKRNEQLKELLKQEENPFS